MYLCLWSRLYIMKPFIQVVLRLSGLGTCGASFSSFLCEEHE